MTSDPNPWDVLHQDRRHRPAYPSEDVIRFLLGPPEKGSLLDIGCGTGRHMTAARELGWGVLGVDSSREALKYIRPVEAVVEASMTDLPFSAARFDACLAFGSLYYATLKEMEQAIHEMWRVLKPGGYSFTSLRTTDDWRYGLGEQLEANTFRLSLPDHPEDGMVVNFVTSAQMTQLFADFSGMMALELSESTTYQRARKNSDWLMTAQK